ncbi:hypothetical protein, partial [Pseudomonas azotoformans]
DFDKGMNAAANDLRRVLNSVRLTDGGKHSSCTCRGVSLLVAGEEFSSFFWRVECVTWVEVL